MNNVFVVNATVLYSHTGAATVDTLATVNTLADGSLAFFQENGIKVTDGGVFVKSDEFVNLYMGRGTGNLLQKCRINLPTLTFNKQAYVAPVASVKHLGSNGSTGTLNLNSVSKQGSYYGIIFTDLSKEVYERRSITIELVTPIDNISSATVVTTLVAAINANAEIMDVVTSVAAVSTTGIIFTGKAGKPFSFIGMGLLESATLADTAAFKPGANTYEWAKDVEYDGQTVEGRSSALAPNTEPDNLFKLPSRVVDGASYTVYTLTSSYLREGYPSANANAQVSDVTILVPAANTTLIASLDAILPNLVTKYSDLEARVAVLEP